MQNPSQETPDVETAIFKPVSLLSLLSGAFITDETWCVSYLKQVHVSGDNAEYKFMLIQSKTTLYKAEIALNEYAHGLALRTDKKPYNDDKTLKSAINKIIWNDDNTEYTELEVFHKTWLIPKDKAERLLTDIIMEERNPPDYAKPVNESNTPPSLKMLFILISVTALCTLRLQQSIPIVGLTVLAHTCFGTTDIRGRMYLTWFADKLKGLDIPGVTDSLESQWTDKVAFVPNVDTEPTL